MKKTKATRSLVEAIRDQKNDPGLREGERIVSLMDSVGKKAAQGIAESVGNDFTNALRRFSSDGEVGRALARSAPTIAGNHTVTLPSLSELNGTQDGERLLAALFDPRFQRAVYDFQLTLSKSSLVEQQLLVKRFVAIDWSKFNFNDRGWFSNTLGLVGAGIERNRAWELQLDDVIPLMKVPCVLDMITLSVGYARMMDASLSAYAINREFLDKMGNDNAVLLKEIDGLLSRIQKAEGSRLQRLDEVVQRTESLNRLMDVATLVADLTNRSVEAEAQKNAGKQLAESIERHSQDTLDAQEAYLEQFMRLNQILVSNQLREGHLKDAMSALNLYIEAYKAFVLMLTMLQMYLLNATSAMKTYMANAMEGSSQLMAAEIYRQKVLPLNATISKYANGFVHRIKPGESRRPRFVEAQASEILSEVEVSEDN